MQDGGVILDGDYYTVNGQVSDDYYFYSDEISDNGRARRASPLSA